MMYSMTGFGKTVAEVAGKKIAVEVKSLNSKNIDISMKIPSQYKEKELEMRNIIKNSLHRGKVEFNIRFEGLGEEMPAKINKKLFADYFEQLRSIGKNLDYDIEKSDLIGSILRMPDVLQTIEEELDAEEWQGVENAVKEALNICLEFRKQEGAAMQTDVTKRIRKIQDLVISISEFEHQRIEKIKQRIHRNKQEFLNDISTDDNRFEQELLFYIEKLDITEEKVRLKNHCNYFLEELKVEVPLGKKLGFISQEMGREINTIGSKANDADIQKIVVGMKDELEKIKEQMMNVL